jgi:hypothetical protein
VKVIKDLSIEVPGTNAHYFNLDEFSSDGGDGVLYYGYNYLESGKNSKSTGAYRRRIYLNVTMPTEFCSGQPIDADDMFDEIYGICPYTNRWLNAVKGVNKYRDIFYPFNERDVPPPHGKKYDVCYHGGIHGEKYIRVLEIMRKFNYRFLSQTHGINKLTKKHLKYATNTDLTNREKLELISECRISICFNTFDIRNDDDIRNIQSRKNWRENKAFKNIEDLKIAPQFKSRCNEAAFSRTLNLVKKDPWNIIEYYYTPDVDFVYFEDLNVLEDTIRSILHNWERYQPMIESAYKKSLTYTTRNLFSIIENNQAWGGHDDIVPADSGMRDR